MSSSVIAYTRSKAFDILAGDNVIEVSIQRQALRTRANIYVQEVDKKGVPTGRKLVVQVIEETTASKLCPLDPKMTLRVILRPKLLPYEERQGPDIPGHWLPPGPFRH